MTSPPAAFEALRAATLCPFARRAEVRYSPPWDEANGFHANVAAHAGALATFVAEGERDALHGFVSEIVIGDGAHDFDRVRRSFNAYLVGLAEYDDDCRLAMNCDKLAAEWQFSFRGMRMFLNVFAPCYQPPHSKFIPSPNSFWVFFQPEYSFDLCNIDPSKIATKALIRSAFREAGMPYDGAQIDRRIESLLYMFPMRGTDGPVRWWD
ncbi:YqcI/YcgG family protein [Methylobacterium fujisawaense]|uniref:YqcI/YcgG family protein n=1 Tax=Methylobacterium fujisawaense TaxID=107400 RepID=UPI0024487BBB|nr:YqcI/YcgG family protein [Methylobacterium fujisawaense]MDH3030143.1 YqcI/YcgG family protein [Methylobacterium fujisawaense]